MALSIEELSQVRTVVSQILEELNFDAYLYEVEPAEYQWELRVECAMESGGWQTILLKAKKDFLLRGADDAVVHALLLEEWREALSGCEIKAAH